ncbi:YheC/YheD family protein [Jeotgalibacillus proteolyticus]|uniref:YheC/YheD family protein n=1 Tax=Jeotgalibacillus proteolyticus TaxID=2082395 RepID=UPI001430C8F4|nr:YheC/YheD family protein [Jeotgalibacillus proteolyticus]
MKQNSRFNKWYKHQLLLESKHLKRFLPETHLYTIEKFWEMMDQYNEVILKPSVGNGGKGIIKVSKTDGDKVEVNLQKSKKQIMFINDIEQLLGEKLEGQQYLLQYCIPLAKVNGNVIDFRYITQRNKGDTKWDITGKYGKIAKDGYITTNILNDGNLVTVEEALSRSNIKNFDLEQTMDALDHLSLALSTCYANSFKNQNIWGFDLAVDEFGGIWIIEANATPGFVPFEKPGFSEMGKKINSYLEVGKQIDLPEIQGLEEDPGKQVPNRNKKRKGILLLKDLFQIFLDKFNK